MQGRRVVITGIGIISSIGDSVVQVEHALRHGRSGTRFAGDFCDHGLRSHVCGEVRPFVEGRLPSKLGRIMGSGVAANYLAMRQAIEDAGLASEDISNPRTGLIMGSGGTSAGALVEAADTLRQRGIRRVVPFTVLKSMCSTHAAGLAHAFDIRGISHSVSAACASSLVAVGHASEKIRWGVQDVMFAGGGEEVHWVMGLIFDAMHALAANANDCPEQASRPFDRRRGGFVISGGGGVVVLEEKQRALARGARIWGEVTGFAETSGAGDIVRPDIEAMERCMRGALEQAGCRPDYINVHATGTPLGDVAEAEALRRIFPGGTCPPFSATKSLTGHALGAAGVHELIYSLLMMDGGFIAPTINLERPDPAVVDMPLVTERERRAEIDCILTNNFGFGGANASLVVSRVLPRRSRTGGNLQSPARGIDR
ncbi:MAG TPA: beta-ketoacyl-ACP synthase I [Gammaproteobacteria bacterium]|nr:beta-ketoacyl-ACP synthase I [Gammaproteobacteria bacterium]